MSLRTVEKFVEVELSRREHATILCRSYTLALTQFTIPNPQSAIRNQTVSGASTRS